MAAASIDVWGTNFSNSGRHTLFNKMDGDESCFHCWCSHNLGAFVSRAIGRMPVTVYFVYFNDFIEQNSFFTLWSCR